MLGILVSALWVFGGCVHGLPFGESQELTPTVEQAEAFRAEEAKAELPGNADAASRPHTPNHTDEIDGDPQEVAWADVAIASTTEIGADGEIPTLPRTSPVAKTESQAVDEPLAPVRQAAWQGPEARSGAAEDLRVEAFDSLTGREGEPLADKPNFPGETEFPERMELQESEILPEVTVQADESSDEELPVPQRQTLPFPERSEDTGPIHFSIRDDRVSVRAIDASLDALLGLIAEQQGLNIVSGDLREERITVTLQDVQLNDALDTILAVKGFTWTQQNNIVVVSKLTGESTSAVMQGREVRVYNLNYVTADNVQSIVTGLLSPAGQVFINQTSETDQRQTHEQLVVEDLPRYLARVETYLQQADIPPKQVVVEAHVLQVELEDDLRHGINFDQMLRVAGSKVSLESKGFAAEQAPTTLLRIEGKDLNGLIEAIQTNTNAKTLASPKVAVLNGQQAKMQVGGQIGYLLTTTTQTSTLQSVDFLEVGVILTVTPIITADHQVLLTVKPEVSTGRINATTQLPESETTQVETKVMLSDGEAIVIGGLIQETDTESESKVPWLGDIKGIGRIFQKRETKRARSEIIIALVPRIISAAPGCRAEEIEELQRATTPLLHGPLHPNNRRVWEPELPSARLP